MSTNDVIRVDTYILSATRRAKNILSDKSEGELIGSASLKLESLSGSLTSLKRDLGTLIELLKARTSGEYREVPRNTLLFGTGAVVYFVNPFDAIPDILPAIGLLDDASVLGFVLASAKNDIERFRKHMTGETPSVIPANHYITA